MLRTNPLRLYGIRTLLSGTLLSSALIGKENPDQLRAIVIEGHELGIHGYDHVRWQDRLEKMDETEIEADLGKSMSAYESILGARPFSTAAPGWRCTPQSLAVQDQLKFSYASDVRGLAPFFPVHDGVVFQTLQVPTTLPTLDELIGRVPRPNEYLLSLLRDGLNVHTIHAEVEGRHYLSMFEDFLKGIGRRRAETVVLREVAERLLRGGAEPLPKLPVRRGNLPGRSGWVACAGTMCAE
jgi:peptidoglycan/xylan/chitin deacetylase (PgdA/CDA1 family)